MARGPKRIGLLPQEIKEGCKLLEAARNFLTRVTTTYPIKFDDTEPYGAAHKATEAIDGVGQALTGDQELFSNQRLNKNTPFHQE